MRLKQYHSLKMIIGIFNDFQASFQSCKEVYNALKATIAELLRKPTLVVSMRNQYWSSFPHYRRGLGVCDVAMVMYMYIVLILIVSGDTIMLCIFTIVSINISLCGSDYLY